MQDNANDTLHEPASVIVASIRHEHCHHCHGHHWHTSVRVHRSVVQRLEACKDGVQAAAVTAVVGSEQCPHGGVCQGRKAGVVALPAALPKDVAARFKPQTKQKQSQTVTQETTHATS
jgi:hypothetical protein